MNTPHPRLRQLTTWAAVAIGLATASLNAAATPSGTAPLAADNLVFEEHDGLVAVEAEHFRAQTETDQRAWYRTTVNHAPQVTPDGDPSHAAGASGGAYLEVLPDTRRTHGDKLIAGENFANEPGRMAVLHYAVHFNTPGRYYVWVRAFSTGSEDNGLHVGLDGAWPASGQRLQWCEGKQTWRWESRQRTARNHCGEPGKIYLEVTEPGRHEILFSMREDGFEFDKFILTTDRDFARPTGVGPAPRVKRGVLPAAFAQTAATARTAPRRGPDGIGTVSISGELKQWHKVTLTLDGPFATEQDDRPNPFTDLAMTVTFVHASGAPRYVVPGYFAADGNAAETSATAGRKWRAHLAPDKPGRWDYTVSFRRGHHAALDPAAPARAVRPYDGQRGSFTVAPTDKTGRDFRARGRLEYVGKHYLRFAGSGEYFLKAGADAPENLLAYADFDGTWSRKQGRQPRPGEATPAGLKTWQAHARDWRPGDPTWQGGKGKGLIGALNYLAGKGCNAFSFLTYNAGGDGDDVWPMVDPEDKLHYDCSKLDQWQIVFDHATARGLYLHFKMEEQENDDNRKGKSVGPVPAAMDGGDTGVERRLYCRELIARFGHELALNWNLGEENTLSAKQQRAMAQYLHDTDPYHHHIVVHTFPNWQDKVYPELLGEQSALTGASLQNSWSAAHQRTLKWVTESAKAGKPWVVANDEQNPAGMGVPPDPGYAGHDGYGVQNGKRYNLDDIRKLCLWGTLMAGGAGVEYYFGYKLPQNDLVCEDWRSRDRSWDYCRIALEFFQRNRIPFWKMRNADELVGNPEHDNRRFCFADPGEIYLVYLPNGGAAELDLRGAHGAFSVAWFSPRTGGSLVAGSVRRVHGGRRAALGNPPREPEDDWLAVVSAVHPATR